MSLFGNIFTHYNYTTTDINFHTEKEKITVTSAKSGLDIDIDFNKNDIKLPCNSPFSTWKEARRYAGPLPFTFTYNSKTKEVLIIEGVRKDWEPKPVEVIKSNVEFIKEMNLNGVVLANAFIIENVPYYWKKGKIEKWKG